MKKQLHIFIADDHPMFRRGLMDVLKSVENISIAGEASDGEVALRMIKELKPDIAILDLNMPKLSGIEILRRLRTENIPVEVIFLTMHDDEDIFNRAMDAGAIAYLLKDSVSEDILSCIHAVAEGKSYITPTISSYLLNRSKRSSAVNDVGSRLSELSPAERRILNLVAENKTSKEIADELFISVRTVDNHRSSICSKLRLSGNNALLRFALEHKNELV
jgi:DNA-binding NarL/FixJ family response regulator